MTISSTIRKAGPFLGNGSAATFPFTFKVFQESDLLVVRGNTVSGAETSLVLDSDYSAALNANQNVSPGGSITLTAGPLASGTSLIVSSGVPELQGSDITNEGGFYAEVITASLDYLTILVQQLQEQVNRCLKAAITDPGFAVALPAAAARAGKILAFGSDGSPSFIALAPPGGTLFSGTLLGTMDGTNKVFTLTNGGSPLPKAPIQVTTWRNFPLVQGAGYSLGPGANQVTFATAPQPAAGSLPADVLFAQGVY